MRSTTIRVVIPNGGTQSTATPMLTGEDALVSIVMPTAWTAAYITFEASLDGQNWRPMHKSGVTMSYPAAANLWIKLDGRDFVGVPYLRLVSSAAQAAEREIELVFVRNL